MPVQIAINLEKLTTEDFKALDYQVMGHLFDSHNRIGRLADERIYQADAYERLCAANLQAHRELPLVLTHKSFVKTLFLDMVVDCRALYEFKTVATLTKSHLAQILTYLYLLDLPHGKLVNFRSNLVESKFVNAPIPREERCGFEVSHEEFEGNADFVDLFVELLRDWGTALSISLYAEAAVALLGGKASVERMLPLIDNGHFLGNQRFHLAAEDIAFHLTAMSRLEVAKDYSRHLKNLIDLSQLRQMHWINIAPHCVTFKTVNSTSV